MSAPTTTLRRLQAIAGAAVLAFALSACGGDDGGSVEVESDASFPAGTTMAKLNKAGKITIGTKFDQPGIGAKKPGADAPEGLRPGDGQDHRCQAGHRGRRHQVGRDGRPTTGSPSWATAPSTS